MAPTPATDDGSSTDTAPAVTLLGPTAAELFELAGGGRTRPAIDLVLGLVTGGMLVEQIITEVLAPVQIEVGVRWESNLWGVADEHLATAAIDGALGALALHAPVSDSTRGSVLVACAEGEYHTMPARMGVELLRADGWEVTFLGGSLPADDLQRYAAVTEPDAVVVSCTVPLFLPGARRCFGAVAALGLPAIAAGAAFGRDDARARRLGASGWFDPTRGLATAVGELPASQPRTAPTPPEAFALELAAEELQRSCLSTMGERLPQMAAYSAAQLAHMRTDVGDILRYLATSIDLADDEIFTSFIDWLAHVLEMRRMPPAALDGALGIIGEAVAAAGMTEAARLCAARRAPSTPL